MRVMSSNTILLTGCAGFIGSHATEEFLKHGYTVVGVDSLTYAGKMKNMNGFIDHSRFFFYKEDICNFSSVLEICQKHGIVWMVNFAAETHVDNSINDCDSFIHSNVAGVMSLLNVCKKIKCKIFHISTDEVYGSTKSGSFSENDILNPKNPYSATKAAAEHLVKSYSNTYDIKYLIARPSNNFGPRQHNEKFLPTIVRSLTNNRKVPVYGNGENVRDWLFVKDNVRAIRYIMESSPECETYNITSKNEMTNLQICKLVCDILDKKIDENINFINDRLGHDFRYSIKNAKLKSIGFSNFSVFEKSMHETVKSLDGEKNE
jgi:dTDP-glucose 4,6-dehydratase